MKLYEYQEELLNSEEKEVVMNWCRMAGKDTALALYILEHKPTNIAYLGYGYRGRMLRDALSKFQQEYNFIIEPINREDFKIIFKTFGKELLIRVENENTLKGVKCDLIIDSDDYSRIDLDRLKFEKYIKVTTKNDTNLKKDDNYKYITVDYKRMIKANPSLIDEVGNHFSDSKQFYREYAILDKPKDYVSFDKFSGEALQKLQKQFLDTPDSKDTVLTRKNIIEMIKELIELNRKYCN